AAARRRARQMKADRLQRVAMHEDPPFGQRIIKEILDATVEGDDGSGKFAGIDQGRAFEPVAQCHGERGTGALEFLQEAIAEVMVPGCHPAAGKSEDHFRNSARPGSGNRFRMKWCGFSGPQSTAFRPRQGYLPVIRLPAWFKNRTRLPLKVVMRWRICTAAHP